MIGNILIFTAGLLVMGCITVPLLRSRGKRIRTLEKENGESRETEALFRSRAVKIAEDLRVTAAAISPQGHNGASKTSQSGGMEKIENTLDENARIAAEIVEKTRSVAAIASKTEEDVLHGFSLLEKNVKKWGTSRRKIRE